MSLSIFDNEGGALKTRGNSAAMAVSVVLGIARGLIILALILTLIFVTVVPFAKNRFDMEVSASWFTLGTTMTIPVRLYVDADAHRITAPAIGVARAELEGVSGL